MDSRLQIAARAAVAQAVSEQPDRPEVHRPLAAKILREKVGGDLRDVVRAVDWAIANPEVRAADLPFGSVVAWGHSVFFKSSSGPSAGWDETGNANCAPNVLIDKVLQAGAVVLRVGTGG